MAYLYAAAIFQSLSLLEALRSTEALARRAVELDSSDAAARSALSLALLSLGDTEGAQDKVELALATSPNLAIAHGILGDTLVYSGRPKEGVVAIQRSMRLDPRDPMKAFFLQNVAVGLYFSREYDAAIEAANRTIRSYPAFPNIYRWLAAALGQLDRTGEAQGALQKAIALAPAMFDMYVHTRPPWFRPEDHAHMLDGLRKAGWDG